jgi:hypothetical protein
MRRKYNMGFFFISFIFLSSLLLNSALGEEVKININMARFYMILSYRIIIKKRSKSALPPAFRRFGWHIV